ncbi:ATP-binding protein [bacterium]|nr:ATP-binding protein [bacterium]
MLKQIQVSNFKVLKDSSRINLQPLTVLIGRNGSGKSSLIEALDWLGRTIGEGAEVATEPFSSYRRFNSWLLGKLISNF